MAGGNSNVWGAIGSKVTEMIVVTCSNPIMRWRVTLGISTPPNAKQRQALAAIDWPSPTRSLRMSTPTQRTV